MRYQTFQTKRDCIEAPSKLKTSSNGQIRKIIKTVMAQNETGRGEWG